MPKNAQFPRRNLDPAFWGLAAILGLTLYRVALLPLANADLFVDEAQYWQWGQKLAWGYYSKPPLIGWVIGAVTSLAQSDSAFWIRLPGALFHAATALILVGAAHRLTTPAAAWWIGIGYLTMPAVAVGAFLISTDTILLPFFAAFMWLYLAQLAQPSPARAVALGLVLGLGMLAKYAALYAVICPGLAAFFVPQARIRWRDATLAALVAGAVFAPNVVWNLHNDLVTLSHTGDNVDWVKRGIALNVAGAAEFLIAQALVMGPILFGGYLWALWRVRTWQQHWLVWMSAPIIALVVVQALLSKAHANWAVTAYPAALMLTVPALLHAARGWLWGGLALNAVFCLALPVALTQATSLRVGDTLLLRRHTGRAALSAQIMTAAQAVGHTHIVAGDRAILADLFYRAPKAGFKVSAIPTRGASPHYYAHVYAFDGQGRAFLVSGASDLPCIGATTLGEIATRKDRAYKGQVFHTFAIPADCFDKTPDG